MHEGRYNIFNFVSFVDDGILRFCSAGDLPKGRGLSPSLRGIWGGFFFGYGISTKEDTRFLTSCPSCSSWKMLF